MWFTFFSEDEWLLTCVAGRLRSALGEGSLGGVSDGVNGPRSIVPIVGVHLTDQRPPGRCCRFGRFDVGLEASEVCSAQA